MPKDVIRLMHALFLPAVRSTPEGRWTPAADVYRTPECWLVKFDLAGVRVQDVSLDVKGKRLRLHGTRRDCSYREGCRYYQMEIAYSDFERQLELPCDLERARISTDYRDGMLYVSICCSEAHGESH